MRPCARKVVASVSGSSVAESTGVEVRKLDPLGGGDWFAMMEENLAELRRALGGTDAAPAKNADEDAKR